MGGRKLLTLLAVGLVLAGCSGSGPANNRTVEQSVCRTLRSMDKYNLAKIPTGFLADLRQSRDAVFRRAANSPTGNPDWSVELNRECSALGL